MGLFCDSLADLKLARDEGDGLIPDSLAALKLAKG